MTPRCGVCAGQAYMKMHAVAVCKTVGSAYVGSNPTPATTCENGPLAGNSRLGGPFPSCHALYQGVSLRVDVSRCPRTYSGRRSVPVARSGTPSVFRGRPRTGPAKGRPGAVPALCAARRPASFRRGGRRDGGRASGAAGRGIRWPAGAGRACARQGAVPGRALTVRDSPRPARRSRSEQNAESDAVADAGSASDEPGHNCQFCRPWQALTPPGAHGRLADSGRSGLPGTQLGPDAGCCLRFGSTLATR